MFVQSMLIMAAVSVLAFPVSWFLVSSWVGELPADDQAELMIALYIAFHAVAALALLIYATLRRVANNSNDVQLKRQLRVFRRRMAVLVTVVPIITGVDFWMAHYVVESVPDMVSILCLRGPFATAIVVLSLKVFRSYRVRENSQPEPREPEKENNPAEADILRDLVRTLKRDGASLQRKVTLLEEDNERQNEEIFLQKARVRQEKRRAGKRVQAARRRVQYKIITGGWSRRDIEALRSVRYLPATELAIMFSNHSIDEIQTMLSRIEDGIFQ